MHVYRTPQQLLQANNKLNVQIAFIQMQLASCNCQYVQQQLQDKLMQLITQQSILASS
jgi:hypothetical protein